MDEQSLKKVMYALIAAVVVLAGVLAYVWYQKTSLVDDLTVEKEELTAQMVALQKDYETLSSDYDDINERHWLPGEGKVDWTALYNALREVGYNGVWMYELGQSCPKTILRDRDLTFPDFYENAMSVFVGEKPRVYSRPKPNLGWWE